MKQTTLLLMTCSLCAIALSAKVASIDFNDGEMEKEASDDNNFNDVSSLIGQDGINPEEAAAAAAAAASVGNKELLKKAMSAAMKRPGAYNRLQQVLPIVRSMSPAQRLAMASLVMSQLTAAPEEPLPALDNQPKNVTENLMLPISLDIATMFRGLGRPNASPRSAYAPQLFPGLKRSRPDRQSPSSGINRRNVHVYSGENGARGKPARSPQEASLKDCQYITNSICATAEDYPESEIMSYLKKSRASELTALLADSINIPAGFTPTSTDQLNVMERRLGEEGGESKGSMCSSRVELARPKRARATSGMWKYIVNTGEYTQTLRLEICSKPGGSCTFLSEEVDSECVQVYNYHRLLTFDESTGLTMDIFKVPTCCSCRVRGYGGQMLSPKLEHSNSITEESRPPAKVIRGTLQRRPTVKHRVPHPPQQAAPLPLEPDGVRPANKYPPYDNSLRRYTRNNSTFIMERGGYHQRHPTLPAESLEAASSSPERNQINGQLPGRPKRVNYSYHPILEFFRPGRTAQSLERRQAAPPEWTPISEPSPAVLASPSYRQTVIGQIARH